MAIIRKTLEQIHATPINKSELERLANMPDGEINYSDMPELTNEQIANFKKGDEVFKFLNNEHYRPKKEQVTVRLDSDVLAWLKQDGRGYQTRLNDLLRQMMVNNHA